MLYNLLHERWIPVRDDDGNTWDIAPHEITRPGPHKTLPVALSAPRPDFNGALIQFLIGLVQTAFAPETERAWRKHFKTPPDAETLQHAFNRYREAFNLDGEGPRFMQDYLFATQQNNQNQENTEKISRLLLDATSDSARYYNKKLDEARLGTRTATMALFTFQINDPGIGRGHRATLRGGGALTTVVLGNTLWQTIWLNVLDRKSIDVRGVAQTHLYIEHIFPWMGETRTSEADLTITREDVHPLQMYWPMPSRLLLQQSNEDEDQLCGLSGEEVTKTYERIVKRHHGINYAGPWQHPLSPTYTNARDEIKTVSCGTESLSYRDWVGFSIISNPYGQRPADVVLTSYRRTSYSIIENELDSKARLWAFGYALDSAKAQCYHESIMPIFLVSLDIREDFERLAGQLVTAAELLVEKLINALKNALFEGKGVTSKSVLYDVRVRFFRETESSFFDYLQQERDALEQEKNPGKDFPDPRKQWASCLRKHVLKLFDDVTGYGTFRGADPKSIAKARIDLDRFANWQDIRNGKKLRAALDLKAPEKRKVKRKRG